MATPNDMPTTNPLAPTSANDINASSAARGLYEDPTPIYQPSIDFIQQQRSLANERYAQNKADITNLFGSLTQVNKESQARVQSQFEKSIADQQMATAQRIAQARQGAQATQESALRAMDERGGGPMGNIQASPAAVAAERGIADIGAYSTIWEGMQGAIGQQTQQNLQANLAALGQTQAQSQQQLQRNLQDYMLGLSGQEAGVRSDLAQAVYGGRMGVREANYNEVLARQEAARQAQLAAIEAANQAPEFSRGTQGILEKIAYETNPESADAFSRSIDAIIAPTTEPRAFKGYAIPGARVEPPTSLGEALTRWIQANPDASPSYREYAREIFSEIYAKGSPARAGAEQETSGDSLSRYLQTPK